MTYYTTVFLLLLSFFTSFGQTNISGVINVYTTATAYDECSNQLSVTNTAGFEAEMKVVIIQMQGATINTSNNASFGDITAMGQAGMYEVAKILSITGNDMVFEHLLVNQYNFNGNVQVVSLPVYESAHAVGDLTATAWNGQTGGVFAVEVTGQMILDATVDVSGKGFRGGVSQINDTNDCGVLTNSNDYSYGLDNWHGASKGEGISIIDNGKEAGRGAQANGGGGGNDHNSGGGGGGNIAKGGQGGENNEPSFFGCSGPFPGIGSKSILQNGGMFMGGGGGAGHENNNVGTDGGAGGGIIFIIANDFTGLGNKLKASGVNAATTFGDGAGGGGGGGSIVLIAQTASGVHFEVKGGNGGDSDNGGVDRCQGPGGGGGGGRIFSSLAIAVPPIDFAGGLAGMSINSSACNNSSNGATNGESGSVETLDSLLMGDVLFLPTAIIEQLTSIDLCEGDSTIITMESVGFDLSYQWQINDGSGFQDIPNTPPFSGVNTSELHISSIPASFHGQQLQLLLSNDCFAPVTSAPIILQVLPTTMAGFSFTQDALTATFSNASVNGSSFIWNFGDSESSTEINPVHEYAAIGTYTIELIATNMCGQDTFITTILFTAPITANFSNSDAGGCAPFEVQFTNESMGSFDELLWAFPGGTPSTSSSDSPIVSYDIPGLYDVVLTASNSSVEDSFTATNLIEIAPAPTPVFTWELLDPFLVSFTNTSQNATSYLWNFGDSQTSTEVNPIHEYATSGDYQVTLNAQNVYCGVAESENIFLTTGVNDLAFSDILIYPNPVSNLLYVKSRGVAKIFIDILTLEGKLVFQQSYFGEGVIDFSGFTSGVYVVRYKNEGKWGVVKMVKL